MNITDFSAEQIRFQAMWSACGIPPRLINASFANYEPICQEKKQALTQCQAFAEKGLDIIRHGQGIFLQGPVGTGKSHLVVSAFRDLVHKSSDHFGRPASENGFVVNRFMMAIIVP